VDDDDMSARADVSDGPDGTVILRVVAMDSSMAAALDEFHERLSPDTVRNRFFTFHPHLSPAELERFTTVDHQDRDAFVVFADQDIVAVARLDRLGPGSSAAEVAFVVADGWQHRGLGGRLLRVLVDRAAQLGITRLEADTLASNRAMQAVFRQAGLPVSTSFHDGVVHVTIEVAPPS
jgi:RimJ/RimL family protein N-acetyltransferase